MCCLLLLAVLYYVNLSLSLSAFLKISLQMALSLTYTHFLDVFRLYMELMYLYYIRIFKCPLNLIP